MWGKDKQNLLGILEAIERIEEYISPFNSADEFFDNTINFDAAMMNFIIIGEMVERLTDQFKETYSHIDWMKIKGFRNIVAHDYFGIDAEEVATLNDELLMEYWEKAENIIAEFNEYGGGPEDEEEEAYQWLNEISELIKEGNISSDAKFKFLDEAFVEYDIGNSGFGDELMHIFFEMCETKEEWEYLVEKLAKRPSDWRKKLIMNIQKSYLCNERAYLETRMENLHYGMDYWDLAEFYVNKGDLQKALETAEQGILKGEGRLTELFQFLFEHFDEERDTANIERIVRVALTRKSEEKDMLDRLFEYHKTQGNYEKAKEALQKAYKIMRYGNYYAEYNKMKEFMRAADWKQIEPKIFNDVQEKDICDYLRICLDKNMKETVLHTILKPPENQWIMKNEFDEFAAKLEEDFPERIIEYYWQSAYRNIPGGNRNTEGIMRLSRSWTLDS
ncbi:MAG: DUF86 domain-containing protein [Candidatus Cloacimonetes bacterium]|nr:DUF86 domain-containing protein [Candidatus Cloacimonadota bacterium]